MRISQKVKGVLIESSTHYFHVKTKILADFQICISVPLNRVLLIKEIVYLPYNKVISVFLKKQI